MKKRLTALFVLWQLAISLAVFPRPLLADDYPTEIGVEYPWPCDLLRMGDFEVAIDVINGTTTTNEVFSYNNVPGTFNYTFIPSNGEYRFGNQNSRSGNWRIKNVREPRQCYITALSYSEWRIGSRTTGKIKYDGVDRVYPPEAGSCDDETILLAPYDPGASNVSAQSSKNPFEATTVRPNECEAAPGGGYYLIGAGGGSGETDGSGGWAFHVEFCDYNAVYVDDVLIGIEELDCYTEMM